MVLVRANCVVFDSKILHIGIRNAMKKFLSQPEIRLFYFRKILKFLKEIKHKKVKYDFFLFGTIEL